MARTISAAVRAASLGLLILASAGLGALGGARWVARHRPTPASAPPSEDACPPSSDDRQVASLRARVQLLEERLAAVSEAPSVVAAEAHLPPAGSSDEAAPVEAAAPAPQPSLVVASKLYEDAWAHDAEDRLIEAARGAGATGEKAGVTCTHDECRVELTADEGSPAAERVHKILSEVSLVLQNGSIVSDESTGKTTIVFSRRALSLAGPSW